MPLKKTYQGTHSDSNIARLSDQHNVQAMQALALRVQRPSYCKATCRPPVSKLEPKPSRSAMLLPVKAVAQDESRSTCSLRLSRNRRLYNHRVTILHTRLFVSLMKRDISIRRSSGIGVRHSVPVVGGRADQGLCTLLLASAAATGAPDSLQPLSCKSEAAWASLLLPEGHSAGSFTSSPAKLAFDLKRPPQTTYQASTTTNTQQLHMVAHKTDASQFVASGPQRQREQR